MTADLRAHLQATLGDAFTLEREIGGGGMSRVYVAEETALRRRIVVKVLPQEMVGEISLARFQREIALAARLQHPHIVPMLASGETQATVARNAGITRSRVSQIVKEGER